MKKMVLSAFACMMLAGTMNAADAEKSVEPKILEAALVDDCLWSVWVVNADGKEVARKEHLGSQNAADCLGLATAQINAYKAKYPDLTVKYISGGTDGPK